MLKRSKATFQSTDVVPNLAEKIESKIASKIALEDKELTRN